MIDLQCPHCARLFQAADDEAGRQVRCPGCFSRIELPRRGQPAPAPAETPPAAPALGNPAIAFACPSCRHVQRVEPSLAGQKLPCPRCGQRLQVPKPPPAKTVLGDLVPTTSVPQAPTPVMREEIVVPEVVEDRPRRRREPEREPPRESRGGLACPYCGSTQRPVPINRISPVGWAIAGTSAVVCFLLGFLLCVPWFLLPLCPLALLIRQQHLLCPGCLRQVD